jgi:hypothetical protein
MVKGQVDQADGHQHRLLGFPDDESGDFECETQEVQGHRHMCKGCAKDGKIEKAVVSKAVSPVSQQEHDHGHSNVGVHSFIPSVCPPEVEPDADEQKKPE